MLLFHRQHEIRRIYQQSVDLPGDVRLPGKAMLGEYRLGKRVYRIARQRGQAGRLDNGGSVHELVTKDNFGNRTTANIANADNQNPVEHGSLTHAWVIGGTV